MLIYTKLQNVLNITNKRYNHAFYFWTSQWQNNAAARNYLFKCYHVVHS